MGLMIEDPEIIAALEELATRRGTTKAQALLSALRAMDALNHAEINEPPLFPRDRVTYRTYRL